MERDSQSRERILMMLKMRGPESAASLARRLGVTAMAVRQHLDRLRRDGLVTFADERRPVGRPARMWRLTDKGSSRFPDTHAELTVEMIGAMRAALGERGVDKVLAERSRRQLAAYRARLKTAGDSLEKRVAVLAAIRREQGYMAEWSRRADGSFLLVENHCPICAAARVCQGLCRDELALFRAALGRGAEVERTDHILAGARRCAYQITSARAQVGAASLAEEARR
ncbi:MAG: helix-turn-helix transcriptional regulator [Candidatus Binataceae bacterium]